jgi:hypothetical protein
MENAGAGTEVEPKRVVGGTETATARTLPDCERGAVAS